jgi:hypothetical protein
VSLLCGIIPENKHAQPSFDALIKPLAALHELKL